MNITISRADNFVVVDRVGFKVNCSEMHALVSVVQWTGDSPQKNPEGWVNAGAGHIEFFQDHRGKHLANLPIATFRDYSFLYEKWLAKKAEADGIAAADARAHEDGALARAALPTS